jgi:hypothetical protein
MKPAERLAPLLPWVNGDPVPVPQVRQLLLAFLDRFAFGGLATTREAGMWDAYRDASASELEAVRKRLWTLIDSGFWFETPRDDGVDIDPDSLTVIGFPSLKFAAWRDPKNKRRSRGSYRLVVNAWRLRDLVPFLAMMLLLTSRVVVSRCPAPKKGDWKSTCGRYFVWSGEGRPPKVCPPTSSGRSLCADRVKAKMKFEKKQRERKAEKALKVKK